MVAGLPRAGTFRLAAQGAVVRGFVVALPVLAALWAAVAYAAAVALVRSSPKMVRASAGIAAALAAAVTMLVIVRTPRAGAFLTPAPLQLGHRVSCGRRYVPAHGIARGALDVVRVASAEEPLADGAVVDGRDTLVLSGWAADAATRHPLVAVCLAVDGSVTGGRGAVYGASRPDVATAFKQPGIAETGFEIRVDLRGLRRGAHSIAVVGVDGRDRDEPIAPARRIMLR